MFKIASTLSVFIKRSATRPSESGARIAAIGATVYAAASNEPPAPNSVIPFSLRNPNNETYQAPQTKNWRNIMIAKRTISTGEEPGICF